MTFYTRRGKRLLDVAVAAIAAVVTAPLHGVCAMAIWVTSGRPVYYTQERAGRGGEPFRIFKFRTMTIGTHERTSGYPGPDAVTPVGKLLRPISLDELPQLLNIIKGDMSLVGPRPALLEQVARYDSEQGRRLVVRPGLTGLAQIRYRNSASWSVRILADLEYIDSMSLATDVLLLLKTVPRVLFGSGVTIGQTQKDVDDLGIAESGGD